MPQPTQDAVRALLLQCLSERRVRSHEIVTRFGVHKSTVSRFKDAEGPFPAARLAELEEYLRECRATRRPEPSRSARSVEIAEAMLRAVPAGVLARALALEPSPARSGPTITLVQRALILHAVSYSGGNMAAAGAWLGRHHRRIARRWTELDRSRASALGLAVAPTDPRHPREKARRQQVAAALLRDMPPRIQALTRELAAAPRGRVPREAFVEQVFVALALRQCAGNEKAAAGYLHEGERIFAARWRRLERAWAGGDDAPARVAVETETRPLPPFHARLVALATEFGLAILAAARGASVAELLATRVA